MESLDRGFDGLLYDWNDISNRRNYRWTGLLVGNGASIAVWNQFQYASLFSKAITDEVEHPLSDDDQALFAALGNTINFEQVLSSLITAKMVNQALGIRTHLVDNRYGSIKRALIETVKSLHIPWMGIPNHVLVSIRNELLKYNYVYSTNYDLLIYWAIMHQNLGGFVDYFFSESFDLGNTDVWDNGAVAILCLHGGLHLYRLQSGNTLKRRALDGRNLLDLFGEPYYEGATPLFISEGGPKEKLSSINKSDYLSFAYNKFSNHQGGLVIFGHSLSENDQHIVDVINTWGRRTIAISMLPDTERNIRQKKSRLLVRMPDVEVYFYNALTHPLGSPDLRVELDGR
jgi:hypothetical protein